MKVIIQCVGERRDDFFNVLLKQNPLLLSNDIGSSLHSVSITCIICLQCLRCLLSCLKVSCILEGLQDDPLGCFA